MTTRVSFWTPVAPSSRRSGCACTVTRRLPRCSWLRTPHRAWAGTRPFRERPPSGPAEPRYGGRMSAENVELIARGYEYYAETGDIYEAFLDENFEWHTASDLPDSDTYRGIAAVRAFIQGWPSAFEDFWG